MYTNTMSLDQTILMSAHTQMRSLDRPNKQGMLEHHLRVVLHIPALQMNYGLQLIYEQMEDWHT